jgi:hypothetical protein
LKRQNAAPVAYRSLKKERKNRRLVGIRAQLPQIPDLAGNWALSAHE